MCDSEKEPATMGNATQHLKRKVLVTLSILQAMSRKSHGRFQKEPSTICTPTIQTCTRKDKQSHERFRRNLAPRSSMTKKPKQLGNKHSWLLLQPIEDKHQNLRQWGTPKRRRNPRPWKTSQEQLRYKSVWFRCLCNEMQHIMGDSTRNPAPWTSQRLRNTHTRQHANQWAIPKEPCTVESPRHKQKTQNNRN